MPVVFKRLFKEVGETPWERPVLITQVTKVSSLVKHLFIKKQDIAGMKVCTVWRTQQVLFPLLSHTWQLL